MRRTGTSTSHNCNGSFMCHLQKSIHCSFPRCGNDVVAHCSLIKKSWGLIASRGTPTGCLGKYWVVTHRRQRGDNRWADFELWGTSTSQPTKWWCLQLRAGRARLVHLFLIRLGWFVISWFVFCILIAQTVKLAKQTSFTGKEKSKSWFQNEEASARGLT